MSDTSTLHILDDISAHIGRTPLVRLKTIRDQEGFKCNLLAKCEMFNAGGSIKDRIAKRMIEEAEKQGRLIPGKSVVIEPTSGNTGIGLSLLCAIKGYRCIIVMPEKMSKEKATVIAALGSEIIRTPTEAAFDSPESHISVARRLEKEIPGGIILDQYGNPNNPLAHYLGTGSEIVEAIEATPDGSSRKVDCLIAGAGTGGTITGVARRIREHNPDAFVLGVDPIGSVLARPDTLNVLKDGESLVYKVEGIGYDFVPDVLDHELVNEWIKSKDDHAFAMTRRLIRSAGLLCGGSSGTAVEAGIRWLNETETGRKIAATEGANVVFILPDSIRNYVTKDWLTAP